jgi:hypothetical protein
MSGLDDSALPAGDQPAAVPGAPSRRSLLRGAAGASAAGVAISTLGGVAAASASTSTRADAGQGADARSAEPIIAHLRDARTGEIDIFRGTTQTRLRDRDLAARLIRACQ